MSKVAVASTDGISINEHFGRAKEFLIYEVEESGEYTFLERRESNPHCVHEGNDHTVPSTAQLLADVEVVLVVQIGPRAEKELQSQGVLALPVKSTIDKALKAYGKRGKFIRSSLQRSGADCQPAGSNGGCGSGCHGCR